MALEGAVQRKRPKGNRFRREKEKGAQWLIKYLNVLLVSQSSVGLTGRFVPIPGWLMAVLQHMASEVGRAVAKPNDEKGGRAELGARDFL